MISKKYIKDLEFKTIEDVYHYILESNLNGNRSQCKELIKKLNSRQWISFLNWFSGRGDLIYYCKLREE